MSLLFDEDSLVPISALQHLLFCERQWALIHLEQIWEENRLTMEGQLLHEKVDVPHTENKGNIKIVRSLSIRSLKLGLTGIADLVEFHKNDKGEIIKIYPVEYKRGKPKRDLSDMVQLCAQALCLEEMLDFQITHAAFFYNEIKKRAEISIDDSLRKETIQKIKRLHEVNNAKKTPPAKFDKKCKNCSLLNWCMPSCTNKSKNVDQYIKNVMKIIENDDV